jgi:uncharacterized protein
MNPTCANPLIDATRIAAPEARVAPALAPASAIDPPFLFAKWHRIVFLHYVADPEVVRRQIPGRLELELHEGRACVTLAAVTMRSFRPCRVLSAGWFFRPLVEQRFLNLRTYVRCDDEPGVLFLWGWLSRPLGLPLPSGMLQLPYAFASLDFDHRFEAGLLRGSAAADGPPARRFSYCAAVDPKTSFHECAPGSLSQFAMDRCTGFFSHRGDVRRFRGEHALWLQAPIEATVEQNDLVTTRFPWFDSAVLAAANYAPGFERVRLGLARRVPDTSRAKRRPRSVLGAFFEMP